MRILAAAAGGGLAFLVEIADKSIRRSSDVLSLVDSRLVVTIPYITTKAELRSQKRRLQMAIGLGLVIIVGALVAAYLFMPPLDLIIAKARVGIFK